MKLCEIQKNLIVLKEQFNAFGNYKYRSCEDILEAVKPLLGDSILTLSDEIVMVGDRFYVKATAVLVDGTSTHTVSACAREPEKRKGMDESQITGAASSYARKYALNGMFCIDDARDGDDGGTDDPEPDPEIMSKLCIMLEENMDGGKVDTKKLKNLMWVKFKVYPVTEEDAKKTVKYLIKNNMLNAITEKK
jgi:hypothetical protein